ncbi:hypothetical protein [Roseovarius salis]|uniref:hypothetical protein n=1 Tax=Roseovarius salis TaxID=3376063 RepID=UPI0037C75450
MPHKPMLSLVTFAAAMAVAGQAAAFVLSPRGEDGHHPRPPEGYSGQWYTTPGGCSYSRARAPGYRVTWHLIINPHHIGQPPAKASCPPML